MRSNRPTWEPWVVALAVACTGSQASAQQSPPKGSGYDAQLQAYLESARRTSAVDEPAIGWMADLTRDTRARRVNDLVTIRVVESIVALGSADTALDKTSNGSAAVPSLFGLQHKLPSWIDPASLVNLGSNTNFKGGGATSRSSELSAVVTARVVEVLPNGDLVLEGAREIDINGDRQVVVLTGVVRPADVMPDNSVFSTRVGQFRIRYFGQGLIKDNLKPGWLIRILNKIF
ncbi:MAG: flagellar basal body L-ring protein FlgH [Acidobacteriota bacterium]